MAVIDEYCLKFKVDGSKIVEAVLKKINGQQSVLAKTTDKTTTSINKQSTALWIFAKRLLGVYSVYQLFKKGLDISFKFAETGNALANMSTVANVSTRTLQKLGYALKKYGGDEKTAAQVLGNLQQRLYAYHHLGDTAAFEKFQMLGGGIPAKTPVEFLKQLSDKLKSVNPDKALALKESIGLDDSVFNLLLKENFETALKNAQVLYSDDDIKKAQQAKENLIAFNHELEKLGVILGKELLPIITKAVKFLFDVIEEITKNSGKSLWVRLFGKPDFLLPDNKKTDLQNMTNANVSDKKFSDSILGRFLKNSLKNIDISSLILGSIDFMSIPVPGLPSTLANATSSVFNQANSITINGTSAPEIVGQAVASSIVNFADDGIYKQSLGFARGVKD